MDLLSKHSEDLAYSPKGRITRLTFIAWHGIIGIITLILALMLILLAPDLFESIVFYFRSEPNSLIGYILYIPYFYFIIIFSIKRLHDINQTGWLSILALIPYINFLFSLYLIFMPGSKEENRFGRPRPTLGFEVVIAGMTIVIICIAILAGVTAFMHMF